MLQIIHDAATLIRQARAHEGVSERATLRIERGSGDHDSSALRLAFVDVVPAGDEVGESEGIPLCVAAPLADELDDKVLDVQQTTGGIGLIVRAA